MNDEDRIRRRKLHVSEREAFRSKRRRTGRRLCMALSQDYDLIILDLMLPGMDGLDVQEDPRKEATRSSC